MPSLLLIELSVDESDSNCLISRRLVCRSSDSSYNLTDSSLVTVGYQLRFWLYFVLDLLIWHARDTIMQSVLVHSCGYSYHNINNVASL